jgi:DHA2 family multidrug resistance protein
VVTTLLARETQRHQHHLVEHVASADPAYHAWVAQLTDLLQQKGHSAGEALRIAQAVVYQTVHKQASMLAYLDDFRFLAIVFFALIPLVFLLRGSGTGRGAPPGH